jgi:hypothetical protein
MQNGVLTASCLLADSIERIYVGLGLYSGASHPLGCSSPSSLTLRLTKGVVREGQRAR